MASALLNRMVLRGLYSSALLACTLYSIGYHSTARADTTNLPPVGVTATLPPGTGGGGGGIGGGGGGGDTIEYGTYGQTYGSPTKSCEQLGMQRPASCPDTQKMPKGIVPSQAYWLKAGFSGSAMQRLVTLYRTVNDSAAGNPKSIPGQAATKLNALFNLRTSYIAKGYSASTTNATTFQTLKGICALVHSERSALDPYEQTHDERLCNEALVRVTEEMGNGGMLEGLKDYLDNTIGVGTDWISWGPLKLDSAIPTNSLSKSWQITREQALCADWNQRATAAGCHF